MDTFTGPLIFSHGSALELLRQPGMELWSARNRCSAVDFEKTAAASKSVGPVTLPDGRAARLHRPLHMLVGHGAPRYASADLTPHRPRCPLPPKSLVRLSPDMAVCGPELCLVQLASHLPFPVLVALTMEFVGSYAAGSGGEGACVRSQPLTTLERIGRTINQITKESGSRAVMRALRYALPGSASPYETRLVELACLPSRWGGYGLPAPAMNYPVSVPSEVRKLARRSSMRFDLYWSEQRVALEYDGVRYHSGEERSESDAGRRDAAIAMGVTYFSIRYGQLVDVAAMDDVFHAVAKALGYRLRIRSADFSNRREELRQLLLSSSSSST